MRIWRYLSFYFFVIPVAGIAVGTLLHEAMRCGYECTGPVTGPIDRATLFVLYLFGYGFPMFMALAVAVLVGELILRRLLRGPTLDLCNTPDHDNPPNAN